MDVTVVGSSLNHIDALKMMVRIILGDFQASMEPLKHINIMNPGIYYEV